MGMIRQEGERVIPRARHIPAFKERLDLDCGAGGGRGICWGGSAWFRGGASTSGCALGDMGCYVPERAEGWGSAGGCLMKGLKGVLPLQDMAEVYRNCIPAPALCSGDVFISHFPPSALSVWQEMEV